MNIISYKQVDCKPLGMWHLSRHGARYPDEDDIILMNSLLVELKDSILKSGNS